MRLLTGGVAHIPAKMEEDLRERHKGLQKLYILSLADLVSCALSTRCANKAE